MEPKQEINYRIDWVSSDEKAVQDRRAYFNMSRGLISDLENLHDPSVKAVLDRWYVHFVDLEGDDFPRVNIDIPRGV